MILFTDFTGTNFFQFRCFIWLIKFKITMIFKKHMAIYVYVYIYTYIPKFCIMVSVHCSCITRKC